jgi:CRISPR-associated endonuclease/helicase Cas3
MNSPCLPLLASDFSAFFREIYCYDPFPWQIELTRRACSGEWPRCIAVPTGSGKTAILDAAVFALATQAHLPPSERTVGRRIFYVVNRRVIVDEAHERARAIAAALRNPRDDQPTVARVAAALGLINGGATSPLECVQLRGGIYRDKNWARSLIQPLIVSSTVDQVGSRILFRGYGVSASMRPIHAALVAHDSLILLDEAHISRPFAQTLSAIEAFRNHGRARSGPSETTHDAVRTPFAFVQMTATPPTGTAEVDILRLTEADRDEATNSVLTDRLNAPKPTRLVIAEKASGAKAFDMLAAKLVEQVVEIFESDSPPRSIAVFVNRVAVARKVEDLLTKHFTAQQITLLIGRMRPFDRDDITASLRAELKTRHPTTTVATTVQSLQRIVVATQCLEVGADFDFDALVTECASLDALRQRLGRLNRGGRPIAAHATVVIRADQVFPEGPDLDTNAKAQDPLYRTALARTWNWLSSIASGGVVDFGLNAMDTHLAALQGADTTNSVFSRLLSPTLTAPVLLPAYLDAWAQTNPEPVPLPDPALFIHGPGRSAVDVQICWRSDLPETEGNAGLSDWLDTISLCPPTSVECLTVPLHEFSAWFFGLTAPDSGDILGAFEAEPPETLIEANKIAIIWRGLRESRKLENPRDLRPGDTIVLRASEGGWGRNELGHLPGATLETVDQAERAFRQIKQRHLIRLRRGLFAEPAKQSALAQLLDWATNPNRDWSKAELKAILDAVAKELPEAHPTASVFQALADEKNGLDVMPYPDEQGVVLVTRHRVPELRSGTMPDIVEDDGEDMLSKTESATPLPLSTHLNDVLTELTQALAQLPLSSWQTPLVTAAAIHDWGKADERFQAMLLNGTRALAWAQPCLVAKSAKLPETAVAYEMARSRAELPKGFRHEFLSVQLAETAEAAHLLPADVLQRTLTLHLVASHHGHARPFAPWVADESPPSVEFVHGTTRVNMSTEERLARPPHRLDSGVAERFWQLTRQVGWWGLAYLETTIRLADQQASAAKARTPHHE